MAKDCDFNTECKATLAHIAEEVAVIRKAVLGNGAKGIKDTVAQHALAIKLIGAGVLLLAGGLITAVVRLTT